MEREKLLANIWKMYLFEGLRSLMLFMPIIVLFFQQHGLSMKEVLLLQALFSIALLVLEVPSGYFSDKFGRKNSIILGSVLYAIGYAVYAVSSGFGGFLAAELILGVGISFISGADSAMLYDSLLALGIKDEYRKIQGRYDSIKLFSEGLGALIGGALALYSLRLPLQLEALITVAAIPVALSLTEPPRYTLKEENDVRQMVRLVKYSLHDHTEIKWLIIYSSLVGASTLTMVWFIQPYLSLVGVPLGWFGIIWSALFFSCSLFSLFAHRYEQLVGKRNGFLLLSSLPVIGYFLLGSIASLSAIGFILLFYFVRGMNNPVLSDYINGLVSSDVRATILSVKNLVGRIIFAVIGPVIGWVSDLYSLQTALLAAGLTYLVLGLIPLFYMRRHKML